MTHDPEKNSMDIQCLAAAEPATWLERPTGCLVLGVPHDNWRASPLLRAVDLATDGLIARLHERAELPMRSARTLMLHAPAGMKAQRILLVGQGDPSTNGAAQVLATARAAASAWLESRADNAIWTLETPDAIRVPPAQCAALAVRALREADYRFERYRSEQGASTSMARRIVLTVRPADEHAVSRAVKVAVAAANGVELARDLGNTPGNICTPTYLASTAAMLAARWPLEVEVLEPTEIEALGLNAFLSVARGSREAPRVIVMQYRGGGSGQAPVVLIGKGVTFDAGGISIKPAAGMDEMKYDMCGAATVLGVLRACAELALPLNLVGVIVACENMPGGNALKPGDVIRSLSGKTIEVLNTDAEGRLALCDALTYAQQRFAPAAMIDIATLTGACVVALGSVHSGLYANRDALAAALLAAGQWCVDGAWRLPLDEDYQSQLKSAIADMSNDGGRKAGSVTAACFLSRFVEDVPWAHLDIAGTAWTSGEHKGGTGRPVSLLVRYLSELAVPG